MSSNYFVVGIVCIIAIFILIFMIIQNYVIQKSIKKYFLFADCVTVLIIASELGTTYFEVSGIPFNGLYMLLNVIGFSISPIIAVLLSLTFSSNRKTFINLLLLPSLLNFIVVVLSPWYGYIFRISSDSYIRGPLFAVYIVAYVSSILFFLINTSIMIKKNQGDGKYTLIILFIFILLGTTVQIFFPQIHVSWLCITFAIIMLYAYFCELSEKEDTLTSLFNRRAYEYNLIQLAKSDKAIILYFDIDNFKNINDEYGHQYGDACLQIVADFIKEKFSAIGKCYRIGGDEFCVFAKSSDEKAVKEAIRDFMKEITYHRELDSRMPTVSIGYSLYDKAHGNINQAVRKADERMYGYKEKNQNYKF